MTASACAPSSPRGGPRTPEGKAKSAQNALRHGLRAQSFALLPHEDAEAFQALVAELRRALAPQDPIELLYVDAIAVAIWREMRADRLEAEAMADVPPAEPERGFGSDLAQPAARASLATIVRYRAAAQAEHRRALALLSAYRKLRAQQARAARAAGGEPSDEATAERDACAQAEPEERPHAPLAAPPPVPEPARVQPRARDREALALRARIQAFLAERAAAEAAHDLASPLGAAERARASVRRAA